MELRHLRYFIAAAEEEHFGRAANRLHVTRPAVSQLIADLENELDTRLFERSAQRIRLTAAGRTFLPQLQLIMGHLGQAITMTKQAGEGKVGNLNIGYGSLTLLHPLFRAAVKRMHERFPEVTMSLFEITTFGQVRALADGKIHAGFMHFGPNLDARLGKGASSFRSPEDETALEHLSIQHGGLGVVVARDHPLARRTSIPLEDLRDEAFVVVPRSSVSPGYGALYSLCQKAGFEPRIVQEVGSIASQLNLVSVGIGVGLTVTGERFVYPAGLSVIPLQRVNYRTTFALSWPKGRADPTLARFIDIVRELACARRSGHAHGSIRRAAPTLSKLERPSEVVQPLKSTRQR